MVEVTAIVRNAHGIHCRPSAVIAKAVLTFKGEVSVRSGGNEIDPRSVMALMTLGLTEGTKVKIRVSGPGEEECCRKLAELFETHFDFPPRPEGEAPPIPTELLRQRPAAPDSPRRM